MVRGSEGWIKLVHSLLLFKPIIARRCNESDYHEMAVRPLQPLLRFSCLAQQHKREAPSLMQSIAGLAR